MILFAPPSPLTFQVGGDGLDLQMGGVPVVRGSWVQYYEPGWTKGDYSTREDDNEKITRPDAQTVNEAFRSSDGLAHGTITYHQEANILKVHYDLEWDGDHEVNIELAAGLIWAPALDQGTLTADKMPTHPLDQTVYTANAIDNRRYALDSKEYQFTAPAGVLTATSSSPITMFDARNGYNQDWAAKRSLLWYGGLALPVSKGKPVTLDIQWTCDPATLSAPAAQAGALTAVPDPAALEPNTDRPLVIPNPKVDRLDWDHPIDITGGFSFPVGMFDHYAEFTAAVERRFQVPKPDPKAPKVALVGGYMQMGLTPGGYLIDLNPTKGVSMMGEKDEGVLTGLLKLASLVFLKNGHLYLPSGQLKDDPPTEWRGVHLFVGPQALAFQKKLWTNVLRPLGFNKAVLQCERTAWDSVPGIESDITMSKADLVKLFAMYRSMGVEPIPLVQSFGHMEWFFHNGKNLDLAMNPQVPYAVDPRKPGTAEILKKLWGEIFATLQPKTVHFGLDEVDMIGVPKDPTLKTELWKTQLGLLGDIARTNGAQAMLWGDQGLAPGEAPDATNGDTPKDAAARRDAIPKGSLIGDWHYVSDPDFHNYTKNLQLWKDAGLQPIASTWYEPFNIMGFYDDAAQLHVGTLQTTWAGYESSEDGMLNAFNQFSAMVLAAEYGWSGRLDSPSSLGYDPGEVFREMYFGRPSALHALGGTGFGSGAGFSIGHVHFVTACNAGFGSRISGQGVSLDEPVGLAVKGKGAQLALALQTSLAGEDGDPVAELSVRLANGTTIVKPIRYGIEVRAASEGGSLPMASRDKVGRCCYVVDLGTSPAEVSSVSLRPLNVYTGLRVLGIELIE